MRENRTYGSEGGEGDEPFPTPIRKGALCANISIAPKCGMSLSGSGLRRIWRPAALGVCRDLGYGHAGSDQEQYTQLKSIIAS